MVWCRWGGRFRLQLLEGSVGRMCSIGYHVMQGGGALIFDRLVLRVGGAGSSTLRSGWGGAVTYSILEMGWLQFFQFGWC